MKNSKKIKLIITDLDNDNLSREELDFNTIDDAKNKIIFHKINTENDVRFKIYDGLKLVHSEIKEKSKKEKDKEKKDKKKDKDDESYA